MNINNVNNPASNASFHLGVSCFAAGVTLIAAPSVFMTCAVAGAAFTLLELAFKQYTGSNLTGLVLSILPEKIKMLVSFPILMTYRPVRYSADWVDTAFLVAYTATALLVSTTVGAVFSGIKAGNVFIRAVDYYVLQPHTIEIQV